MVYKDVFYDIISVIMTYNEETIKNIYTYYNIDKDKYVICNYIYLFYIIKFDKIIDNDNFLLDGKIIEIVYKKISNNNINKIKKHINNIFFDFVKNTLQEINKLKENVKIDFIKNKLEKINNEISSINTKKKNFINIILNLFNFNNFNNININNIIKINKEIINNIININNFININNIININNFNNFFNNFNFINIEINKINNTEINKINNTEINKINNTENNNNFFILILNLFKQFINKRSISTNYKYYYLPFVIIRKLFNYNQFINLFDYKSIELFDTIDKKLEYFYPIVFQNLILYLLNCNDLYKIINLLKSLYFISDKNRNKDLYVVNFKVPPN